MKNSNHFAMTAVFMLMLLLINVSAQSNVDGEIADYLKIEEKKRCNYESKKFWGICLSDSKCGEVCTKEGFEGGDCKGLRRRCYCFNNC
ncbi:hypothetical protein ABFS82_12G060300 [Erythranthe guttata]